MKKWLLSLIILSIAILGAACGTDATNSDKEKTSEKQEKVQKKETAKKEATSEAEKEDADTNTTSDDGKDNSEADKPAADENQDQSQNKDASENSNDAAKQTIAAPQIDKSAFSVSNVLPITGGQVTTVSGNYSPSFIKDFNSLVIRINQYKVERVQNPTKEIDVYSPESYMKHGGYVVTLDVSIFNKTTKDITYKAEQINLVGKSKSTGGSLDNFIPNKYHLAGSAADPYVFSPGKTAEGFITYMMDDAKYADFKASPSVAVPSPGQFDASLPKSEAAVATLTLN
ncbi:MULTISPECIES: DUF5068 domain-containing protein [Listeria]|uniref:DUF5068 domain-containing protein n=1 Tax=Listeria TaxID=1637 RepID=UPI000B589895|nr:MULTISPECIES: DUF5068 domain-containing protein [Listeria]